MFRIGDSIWLGPDADSYVSSIDNELLIDIDPKSFEAQNRASLFINSIKPKQTTAELARFGINADGGYILVNDISKDDHVISFGVSTDISFEKDILNYASSADLYDYSIEELPENLDRATFFKTRVQGISNESGESLDTIASKIDSSNLILKMDIEGWEWDVLENTSIDTLKKFRQIAVEMHWSETMLNDEHYKRMHMALLKISKTHQSVIVNPNNCSEAFVIGNMFVPSVVEVTFLRKTDYKFLEYTTAHSKLSKLQHPNTLNLPEMFFPY